MWQHSRMRFKESVAVEILKIGLLVLNRSSLPEWMGQKKSKLLVKFTTKRVFSRSLKSRNSGSEVRFPVKSSNQPCGRLNDSATHTPCLAQHKVPGAFVGTPNVREPGPAEKAWNAGAMFRGVRLRFVTQSVSQRKVASNCSK